MHECKKPTCHGTVTVGTKGQVVIPAEARASLNINTGDKLIVLQMPGKGVLGLCKVEEIERMLSGISSRLDSMREAVAEVRGQ